MNPNFNKLILVTGFVVIGQKVHVWFKNSYYIHAYGHNLLKIIVSLLYCNHVHNCLFLPLPFCPTHLSVSPPRPTIKNKIVSIDTNAV